MAHAMKAPVATEADVLIRSGTDQLPGDSRGGPSRFGWSCIIKSQSGDFADCWRARLPGESE